MTKLKKKNKFFPDLYVDSVFLIDYDSLKMRGITTLLFDIDNTVALFEQPVAEERVCELFDRLRDMGFYICLVSNNGEDRVMRFAESLNVSCGGRPSAVFLANKPFKSGILRACVPEGDNPICKPYAENLKHAALIGDQIFTDIYGGNRLGLYTILVAPMAPEDGMWFFRMKRKLERFVLRNFERKGR